MQQIRKILPLLLLATCASSAHAQESESSEWLKDVASRITVNGYAQAGYTYVHNNGANTNTWDVKRTLLWAKARVTDRWSFLFMHDFSSVVQEFYTDYRISRDKSLNVRFGQFKTHLSLENQLSPTAVELIDVYGQAVTYLTGCGSDPLWGINYGRDLGIDIYGELFGGKLLYNFEIMNGRGVNKKDADNKKDVIVKLDYRPVEGLRLVATAQKGYGTALEESIYIPEPNKIVKGETYRRDRWTAGFEYKSGTSDFWKERSVVLRGEVLGGRDGKTNSWGGYLTTSIPLKGCWDVIASYDYFNYAKGFDRDRTQLILGLQYWFFRKCRVQAQYTWADTWTQGLNTAWIEKPCNRIQVQTQIQF